MILQRASIFFFLIFAVVLISCEPNNPFDRGPVYDEEGNLAKDSLLIVDYLETAEIDSLYRIHDPSGVVIIVQEEGTSSRPGNGNLIHVNYTGSLLSDGSVFETTIEQVAKDNDIYDEDATYRPISFTLGGNVITGWNIGFSRLRSGSKAKLIIPSTWGYRDDPDRAKIPANSVLIFDVEFKGMD
ncbi:FKBP-type peptidyl-prolyl cis-trans isomerase [Algoriphagus sp. D3-2-R+10]|uniref:FKBP-type peptidyl-prolyl cis-trans isomerase n=1 Tax=Algoriphagus aurantiacus TaxID=3103948 RepID=UPI002B38D12E|nr:FKBP-type peptidyl-prolyl cis-trans isomerase [Algoriphagus sp. D3-2-R+10]MEB2774894.1 FKBP-type peptidyl-prolyl cis-trans isomerase [Algoriphagus sp. D3-2-R+10]